MRRVGGWRNWFAANATDLMRTNLQSIRERFFTPMHGLALGFGVFLFTLLPAGVAVMNDDFGYLGSVIGTIQRWHPWTDDWLEPWAASLSVFSAIIYRLTGSFLLATQGTQAVYAGAGALLACLVLRGRGIASPASVVLALLALTFPTVLWKLTEFTGMALYVPCLLGAVWAADRRRWGWFFAFWLIAFASRQSAIAWLALPLWSGLAALRQNPAARNSWLHPLGLLGLALVAWLLLSQGMNHTQSQAMLTDHIWQRMHAAAALRNYTLGAGIGAIALGVGALLFNLGSISAGSIAARPARLLGVLALAAVGFTFRDALPVISFEHGGFGGWSGQLYANLLLALGVAGWMFGRFSIRWEFAFASVVALGLAGLRPDVWDYYLVDVAVLAFFSVASPPDADQVRVPAAGYAALLALLAGQLFFAFELKCRVDRDYAAVVVAEQALRSGRLDVTEIGSMPFGFIGWKLHRHFVANEGRKDPDIGGFAGYLQHLGAEPKLSRVRFWTDSKSLAPLEGPDAARVIGTKVFRTGWFWHQRYTLLAPAAAGNAAPKRGLDHTVYRPRLLPLTDKEWRKFIAEPERP